MVSSFTLMNKENGNSITFGQTTSSECLYKDDGVDWGNAPATHNTFSYPSQLGEYISSTSVKGRDISIMGYVYYLPNEAEKANIAPSEMEQYCYNKMRKKKELLNNIVNPTQVVRLEIGDYYIEGKPSKSIIYGSDISSNNQYFCSFLITIFCNNPMFRKITLPNTVLSGTQPAFRFPLVFTQNKGIIMGVRSNYRLIAIENEGNVPTGGIIQIKSNGTVVNPTLTNIVTGEFITVNKTMVEGEIIEINTNDGNEKGIRGYLNDEELNYFKYWDFDNTWIKFPIGTTMIGFSTEEGDESLLEITITMNPLKYALEDM